MGAKRPNAWGLYDMIGNVAELANSVNPKNSYPPRLGMGFFDVLDDYDHIVRAIATTDRSLPEQVLGLTYPDVGFRVLLQNTVPPVRQSMVPPAAPHASFVSFSGGQPRPAPATRPSSCPHPARVGGGPDTDKPRTDKPIAKEVALSNESPASWSSPDQTTTFWDQAPHDQIDRFGDGHRLTLPWLLKDWG